MTPAAMQCRAFIYTGPGRMELRPAETPPPGPGQMRCRTVCSLVSIGTEMTCYAREVEPGSVWDEWIQYPFEPGYSSVGRIVDVGGGVEGLRAGDLVCSNAPHRGSFTDNAENIYRVPENVSPESAAWFQLNIIVQNGIRETRPVLGESAVVIGLGPLGQLAVRLLGLCGLSSLVAVDPSDERCALAEGNGPDEILAATADAAVDRVRELTGGRGAEIVFDITGHPAVFHAAQHMLARRGRLGLIGDVPKPGEQTLTHDIVSNSISIVGAHGAVPPRTGNDYYRWGRQEMTEFFFGLVAAGRISLDELTTHRITPGQAPERYAEIHAERAAYMGVFVDWTGEDA
ncbi:MAG: zinc-binding dehydrogenase [Candidatus Glassbacteria bacterium]|nr:zinc-binding dehydrogenase [Candidatus Glassbacteria bacterium]